MQEDGDNSSENVVTLLKLNSSKAKSDLILSISLSELKQVKRCKTSHEGWLKLDKINQSKVAAYSNS